MGQEIIYQLHRPHHPQWGSSEGYMEFSQVRPVGGATQDSRPGPVSSLWHSWRMEISLGLQSRPINSLLLAGRWHHQLISRAPNTLVRLQGAREMVSPGRRDHLTSSDPHPLGGTGDGSGFTMAITWSIFFFSGSHTLQFWPSKLRRSDAEIIH